MKCYVVSNDRLLLEGLEAFKTFFAMPYEWHDLAEFKQIDPDNSDIVIIANENPEKLDGLMNIQKVRSLAKLAATPIIFLSEKLSEDADVIYQDFDFVWPSEIPFHSNHFFTLLEEVVSFGQTNKHLITQINQVHTNIEKKNFDDALQILEKIDGQYPSKFRKNLVYGRLHLELQNFPKALGHIKEAISFSPKSLEAHNLLASIYHKMNRPDEYQKVMMSMTKMAEVLLKNLIHWGNLFLEQGRTEKSITAFEAALKNDPENILAKHGLLAAHLIEGRTSIIESKNFADYQSLELARLFNLKGIAMAESGNFSAAERLYQNSLKILPHENLAHKLWMNLGLCMKKKGNLDRAKDYFTKSQSTALEPYPRAVSQIENIQQQLYLNQEKQQNFADNLRRARRDKTLDYGHLTPRIRDKPNKNSKD